MLGRSKELSDELQTAIADEARLRGQCEQLREDLTKLQLQKKTLSSFVNEFEEDCERCVYEHR